MRGYGNTYINKTHRGKKSLKNLSQFSIHQNSIYNVSNPLKLFGVIKKCTNMINPSDFIPPTTHLCFPDHYLFMIHAGISAHCHNWRVITKENFCWWSINRTILSINHAEQAFSIHRGWKSCCESIVTSLVAR